MKTVVNFSHFQGILIILAIIVSLSANSQIQSTDTGGLWSETSTWNGGIVPGPADDVIIIALVSVDSNTACNSITINSSGILQNHFDDSYDLSVFGNISNNGHIRNNVFNLVINTHGDITQNGIWENFYTRLHSASDQSLYFYQPFSGQYLNNSVASGKIIAQTPLHLIGTNLDLNNDTILFSGSYELTFQGGFMDQGRILSDNGRIKLHMTDDAVIQKSKFIADTIELSGVVQFQSAPVTFKGTVVNEDTLRNYQNSTYQTTVDGTLINHGVITNNVYKINLEISGDIVNHGTWNTNYNDLNGGEDQNLFFFNGVSMANMMVSNTAGKIVAQTDLEFINSEINLDYDTLILEEGSQLYLSASVIDKATIINDTFENNLPLTLNFEDDSQLRRCNVISDSIILEGTVQAGNGPIGFFGNVTVNGTLQNFNNAGYSASVSGHFVNNGAILNNGYGLNLTLSGNITHNGIWKNDTTFLNGNIEQKLLFNRPFEGNYLQDTDNGSRNVSTGKLIFIGTDVNFGSAEISLPEYSMIYIKNGSLNQCSIASNVIDLALLDNSYCKNITVNDVTLYGTINAGENINLNGYVILKGILQNTPGTNCHLDIAGDLRNFGTIQNNDGELTITLRKNLYNNGEIQNEWLLIDNTIQQTIDLQNENNIEGEVKLYAQEATTYEWFRNGTSLLGNSSFSGTDSDTLNFLIPVCDTLTGTYNCLTDLGWSRNIVIDSITTLTSVNLTAYLLGPFNGTEMNTRLNSEGQLPLNQPYDNFPWYYPGSEDVPEIPSEDVVDWVLIQFKDAASSADATQPNVIDKQAALLLKNGEIVNLDGTSNLDFYHIITDSLYIDIIHRNHLTVMSSRALILNNGLYNYSFTSDSLAAYGGTEALSLLSDGPTPVYGLNGGDANNDGSIDINDKQLFWVPYSGHSTTYDPKDLNLDGQVDNRDKNDVWIRSTGKAEILPE